jgi:hypothetical protein
VSALKLFWVNQYLKPGAIVPVDMETTTALIGALREAAAERQKILDFIDEFRGSEEERHPMFSEGYDYALHQIEQVMGVADEQPRD